jgi:hypothetical protein
MKSGGGDCNSNSTTSNAEVQPGKKCKTLSEKQTKIKSLYVFFLFIYLLIWGLIEGHSVSYEYTY